MSDLGEAPGSSKGGGGGGGGLCRRYVPTERHGFQAVCSEIGYQESLGSRKLINWLKILVYTRQTGNCPSKLESKARSCRYSTKENPE